MCPALSKILVVYGVYLHSFALKGTFKGGEMGEWLKPTVC